ncbi:hypothetical protein O9992_06740 [Vibrio lentus]|nr:hypothetical protein [Vibrio lentus]
MRSVMTKIRNRPLDAGVGESREALVDDITETLVSDADNVTLHLMNADFYDIYFHTLNVSVIALMIGTAKGYTCTQLKDLSFAALFQ